MANIGPWTNQNERPRDLLSSGACVDSILAGDWPARWTENFSLLGIDAIDRNESQRRPRVARFRCIFGFPALETAGKFGSLVPASVP